MPATPKTTEILTQPLPAEGLTANQYRRLEKILEDWEAEIRENAARFPKRSYELGVEQTLTFLRMLGLAGQTDLPPAGEWGPTKRAAVAWQKTYTLHELDGALDKYLDQLKSGLLYGLQAGTNPTDIAAWLYKATQDATINWRTVARTEMVRANAAGRLDAIAAMGYDQCWAPRHTGACAACRRLLEGRVFTIAEVRTASNFGRAPKDWVACIPLHPHCRHVWLPYVKDVYDQAQAEYQALDDNGLDDRTLNEMFDSGGHLKPQYENDPRILAYLEQANKIQDPLSFALATAVAKTRREEPPGLHHTSGRRNCGGCSFYERPECERYNWQVDRDELCAEWTPREVGKGFFDPPQIGLDPLIWTVEDKVRPDVRDRIVNWWRSVMGPAAPMFSHLYVMGSATSRAWAGRKLAGDVDVHILIDWEALRKHHPEYKLLSDPELHAAIVTTVWAAKEGVEVAPGLALDAYVCDEPNVATFESQARTLQQGVYDLTRGRWITTPPAPAVGEVIDSADILEGEGGHLAAAHPDWLKQARALRDAMTALTDRQPLSVEDLQELRDAYEYVHQLRNDSFHGGGGADGLGGFLWRYLMDFGPLARVKHLLYPTDLLKIYPGYTLTSADVAKTQPAAAGTEHWITVHPHGEDEKGIPVLIRENGDGSATVIGGAGGHLDFLRITHRGRIKPKAGQKDRGEVAQAESPEDAAAREAVADQAREHKTRAQSEYQDAKGRIEDLVRTVVDKQGVVLGEHTVGWDELSATQRKQLVSHAMNDSLYQGTYGSMMDKNRAEAPSGPIVVQAPPKQPGELTPPTDPKADPADTADDSTNEAAPSSRTRQRLRIPMPADIADQILEEQAAMSVMRKRVMSANKVLNAEGKPVDATTLEWEPIDRPAEAQRRAALKVQQQINRELLGQVDKGRQEDNSLVSQALRKGAFDAFDALTHQVLGGKTMLSTGATDLLGVNGTAQLVAHVLQDHARNGEMNLKTLQSTIDEITDDRQAHVTDINLNRAKNAAREVREMGDIYAAGMRGQSTGLRTLTSAKSRMTKKSREAAMSLGMAVSGSEALHTLRALLAQPIGDITVPGFTTPAQIKERAAKAHIPVNDSDIVRNGPGDYSLRIKADRVRGLLDLKADKTQELRDQLSKIRTGQDLENAVEAARTPPGYARKLDPAQAKGSMFLRAAGSGVLAFAPGVGKTDTAIGAALEKMAEDPSHRVLIVAPPTALAGAWARTIQAAAPGKSINVIGHQAPTVDDDGQQNWGQLGRRMTPKQRAAQAEAGGADFNIIGFDTLKKNPDLVKGLGHTIMVVDEMQYAKNADSQRLRGLDTAAAGVQHRWALTGTPLEKNMGEFHTMLNWARPGEYGGKSSFEDRYKHLNQYDHLSAEEKVQQFREATSTGAFFQSQDATSMPAFPDMQMEHVDLADGHRGVIEQAVAGYNKDRLAVSEANARIKNGEDGVKVPSLEPFGGRGSQLNALMKPQTRGYHGPNTRVDKIADLATSAPPVKFDGFQGHAVHADGAHAGTYAPKTIIFGRETQPLQPVRDELERRGTHKVFYTDGSVGDNDQRLAAFMAHDGPAVLITSDTNKTARSLQFGDNGGTFQHGATRMIHADLPQNNADLQQRIARIWRRGAQADCSQHVIYSGTPVEQQAFEQLNQELRTQQALGNPEDKVGGRETLGQKLDRKGQKRGLGRRRNG